MFELLYENNRRYLVSQSLLMAKALLDAGEPLRALHFLENSVPLVAMDSPEIEGVIVDLKRRTAHAFDFEKFKAHYAGYSMSAPGHAPFADSGLLQLPRMKQCMSWMRTLQPKSLLEIGCHDGTTTKALLEQVPGIEITVSDISDTSRIAEALPSVTFQTPTTMTDWPLGPFEAIMCTEVLEHVADQMGFLSKLTQRLSLNGHMVLSTPNARYYVECGKYFEDSKELEHLTANTPETLLTLVDACGLSVASGVITHDGTTICLLLKRK